MRVGGHGTPAHLGVDVGAALLCVTLGLDDERGGALAEDEAVAVGVERPAGGRRVVVACGESLEPGEGRDDQRCDGRLRAAGDHCVDFARAQQPVGLKQGIVAARAGQGGGRRRPGDAEFDRDQAGDRVRHHVGDEKRVRLPRTTRDEPARAALHARRAPAPGVESDAVPMSNGRVDFQARVGDRLLGRGHREVGRARDPARRLAGQPLVWVEVVYLAGDLDVERLRVERGDRAGARVPGLHPPPEGRHVIANRRYGAQPRDHDPAVVGRRHRARIAPLPALRSLLSSQEA